ncbi:MAG TPA: hypothetical protein PLS53_16910, partial [Thermoanaerobaculaceae bacterium]|nr:hypothetical protein [Thermoanaerobaculaceae bacterium]
VVISSVLVEGGVFKMWYTGRGTTGPVNQLGYATSPDGAAWTKYAGNPVMSVGAAGQWDSARVREASVVHIGSTYHMWYAGTSTHPIYRIGYATSPDGLVWTKNAANPVLGPGAAAAWDDSSVYAPQVVHYGGTFHMWFSAGDGPANNVWQLGYASSCDQDGVAWVKDPDNPVLTLGTNPSWECGDSVDYNTVFRDGTSWVMWYSGVSARCGGTDYRLGRAMLVGALPPGSTCQADLRLVKAVDFPTRLLGEDAVFTITVTNLGGNCASDVQVTDLLPAGLTYQSDDSGGAYTPATGVWGVGPVNAGASAVLHLTARATTTGVWLNRAEITQTVPVDPVPGNNSFEVTVTVDAPIPTPTPTSTPTFTPTPEPTSTPPSTPTSTPTLAPTATSTPTLAPTLTATPTFAPTATSTPTLAPTATSTPTLAPTSTATPTFAPTATPTSTLAPTTTSTPTSAPTSTATPTPTRTLTAAPTATSTPPPTATPTLVPTSTGTPTPTPVVSAPTPTSTVTSAPTSIPTPPTPIPLTSSPGLGLLVGLLLLTGVLLLWKR